MASPTDITRKTKWYINIRWFVLIAIVFSGVGVKIFRQDWSTQLQLDLALGLAAIATNGIFLVLTRRKASSSYYRLLTAFIIYFDIFLVDFLIFIKGGIESRSAILFVAPILMSAAIFGRRSVYLTSITSIFVYDALLVGNYLHIIPVIDPDEPGLSHQLPDVIESIAFFGTVIFIISILVDFMTKLLIENEHLASEHLAELKRAQAIAKLGSWEWDISSDEMTCSDEMHTLLPTPFTTARDTFDNYLEYVYPSEKELVRNAIKTAFKRAKPYSVDHRTNPNFGPIRYLRSGGKPIFDNSGKLVKFIGTIQDVTESKVLDEAKSDFVALASHQLRTPATAVKQYLGMLLDDFAGQLTPEQKKFVTIAYESNDRQLSIVDDLLHVAQVDSHKMELRLEAVDIVALTRSIIDEGIPHFQKLGQTTLLKTRYEDLFYMVDANHFRMALENLIDNAHKYTPHSRKITIHVTKTKDGASISVSDQGVGIAEQDIPQLFRKFSRVANPLSAHVGGTGLGLYWSAKIIALHGGKITATSILGKGSTFTITLPKSLEAKLPK